MVYFYISPVGFNCGFDKNDCSRYPDYCKECVKTQLEKFGLDLNHKIKFTFVDSEEKRMQMFQDLIWQKFLDVLNLKHIILIAKDSGMSIVNYPISGAGVNIELLTGFTEANISFSETSNALNGNINHKKTINFMNFNMKLLIYYLKMGNTLGFVWC